MTVSRDAVLAAVARCLGATGERDKVLAGICVDLYFPAPLNCIVQFDEASHCTRERAATFAGYPADVALNFDVRRYLADTTPGDLALARQDMAIDLLPTEHGLNPTVRLRFDELSEPLDKCVAGLLAKRFAVHAGTTFHLMLENAGAKPHRTVGG